MIQTAELLKVFQQYRGEAIVIPGRGGRHWVNVSTSPTLDAPLGDPAMGGHVLCTGSSVGATSKGRSL
jgi:hypothetical protein